MPRTVAVVHPVFARHVPRGRRKPVTGGVATTTPVTLVEADPASFRHVRTFDYTHAVHEHEGALWLSLPGTRGPATPDDLAAYLSGEVEAKSGPFGAHRAFAGTPLVAMDSPGFLSRGLGAADMEGGKLVVAEFERAADRVRSHLDANVRIAGEKAFVRSDLLACIDWSASNVYAVHRPCGMRGSAVLAHPADFRAAWDHLDAAWNGLPDAISKARKRFFREHAGIPFDLVPRDTDEGPTLAYLVRLVDWSIGRSGDTRGLPTGVRRSLTDLSAAYAGLIFDASTGEVGVDRLHEALALHRGFLDAAGSLGWIRDLSAPPLAVTASYVKTVVAPRIRAKAIDPDDALALGSLRPRP